MIKKILVLGEGYGRPFHPFGSVTFDKATPIENVDLVCFTGGSDVSPKLYYERALPGTYTNLERDILETAIYRICVRNKIPMIGICRGFQFINVMNSGKMIQHVNGHAGKPHSVTDQVSGEQFSANSYHHQSVILPDNISPCLLSTNRLNSVYERGGSFIDGSIPEDMVYEEVEGAYFPDTLSAGVQYHPEMMPADSRGFTYFQEMIERLLK